MLMLIFLGKYISSNISFIIQQTGHLYLHFQDFDLINSDDIDGCIVFIFDLSTNVIDFIETHNLLNNL